MHCPLPLVAPLAFVLVSAAAAQAPPQAPVRAPFTLEQVTSYPFPTGLAAAAHGGRIAYALDEQGRRNVWVADAPAYVARRLTNYTRDDGQELTSVALSADGRRVIYVRGGEHSSNWIGAPPNPLSLPAAPKIELWSVPFEGGTPQRLGEGDSPVVSPNSDIVAFVRERAIWTVPIDGSATAKKLFDMNGTAADPRWSPDGARLAFVSDREDHAIVGIYAGDSVPIRWIAPSTQTDGSPRWSRDGARLAFVRTPGTGGAPDSVLVDRPTRWSVWIADSHTGAARPLWTSPGTLRGSIPGTHGGTNLLYGDGRVAFLSEMDGWPHLYSVPESGGDALLLTPGQYMAEHVAMSPDGRTLAFAGNAGADADDIDRRHVVRVPLDRAAPEVLTPGAGLEWAPAFTGDGATIAFIGATAQRPPVPAVVSISAGTSSRAAPHWVGLERIPADFPASQLVVPRAVTFRASDGQLIHGQLFEASGASALAVNGRKPALVYVHGGPPRQMLLGWHYSEYYANAYASNQYLASRGFVVLSVNYRLGIGYGRDFQHAARAGSRGASEYLDVLGGGRYLRAQAQVDPARVGIYGGSYGGFLTALALARNSDLFAAGVDIHGVHDFTVDRRAAPLLAPRYERPADTQRALDVAWASSPVASVATWRSPVLLIHGDDDRNVRFGQTISLARRLERAHVPMEELVIPDDTHHMMRHANWVTVDSATAAWLEQRLGKAPKPLAANDAAGHDRRR